MSCNNGNQQAIGAADWGLLQFERRRTSRHEGYLWQSDGDTGAPLQPDDELQFDIFRDDGDTPILRIRSDGITPGGSTITINSRPAPAEFTLIMGQADAASLPKQTLSAELAVEDTNQAANKLTTAGYGEVTVVRTAALV